MSENLEGRFKLYAAELTALQVENDGEGDMERERVLRDNIDFVLDRALFIGDVASKPLEPTIYRVSFPGRANGELRRVA